MKLQESIKDFDIKHQKELNDDDILKIETKIEEHLKDKQTFKESRIGIDYMNIIREVYGPTQGTAG